MKKILTVFMVIFVLAFVGAAFAADGGHAGHVAPVTPDTGSYVPMNITSNDVDIIGASVDQVQSITNIASIVPAGTKFQITQGKTPVIHTAIALSLDLAVPAPASIEITIASTDKIPAGAKAYIKNHKDGSALNGVFVPFEIASEDNKINFNVTSPDEYFSEANILFATEKDTPSSGGSSSGCNAGFAGLLLLAAVPLLYFRKK